MIHSPAFRRLQGKTQLFPGKESDFFRNRLTHSLEVAQIAKSIAIKLNHDLEAAGEEYRIEPDIVEFAGLAHDLGHPPFGHFGEQALDEKMAAWGGFEGNAQTLRILATTEKRHSVQNTTLGIDSRGRDKRLGLNLAARSLASILKYDHEIPFAKSNRKSWPEKGYYKTERHVVRFIKDSVCNGKQYSGPFKTVECQIMDMADDIAYSVYDLEDSFKAGFLKPIDLLSASGDVLNRVSEKLKKTSNVTISADQAAEKIRKIFFGEFELPDGVEELFAKPSRSRLEDLHFFSITFANSMSNDMAENAYYRVNLTSKLVGSAIRKVSISGLNRRLPPLSQVDLEPDKKTDVDILKHTIYESQILSPKIQMVSFRGKDIVATIFDILSEGNGYMLMPVDFRVIYEALRKKADKKRLICDFIAGMSDRYALEFYGRLVSENPQTIFKPL